MNHTRQALRALLLTGALALPSLAQARTAHEAELEARLARLEGEMIALKADLQAARQQQTETAQAASLAQAQATGIAATAAKAEAVEKRVASLEARPTPPAEGFRDGNTTVRLGGYLKLVATNSRFSGGEMANNTQGRDFWLPQSIPVGKGPASRDQDFSARQTRLWLNFASDIAGHAVKGYVETDFETTPNTSASVTGGGNQRTTNGYTLALRRAWMQVDKWTFGQDWTTFQYTGALPESTDYVGTTEGTVFVRQPLVRYSQALSKELTLHVAAENPETASASLGAPALTENGDDHLPDATARLAYAGKIGELSLAGLARQLRVQNGALSDTRFGWGLSAAGKLYLSTDRVSDLRFMATYGNGAGRYIGVNFAPDAVLDPASGQLHGVSTFAAMAALRLGIASGLRANLMGSYQHVRYADDIAAASIATYNREAWSVAGNLFWSPVRNIDLGIELRHGQRKLVNGGSGKLDRVEFAAKYGF